MPIREGILTILCAGAPLMLAACGGGEGDQLDVAVIGAPDSPFVEGARLPPAAQLVRAATDEGLVGFDEQGQVTPGVADRWIITDDGATYIFRLRDGSWPDGTAISGESARVALRQAIDRISGTPLALDLADIGEVRAMAGRVIEIRLKRPVPELLQLLAQPELGLLHRGGGGGPMLLVRHDRTARLTAIPPGQLGLPQPDDWEKTVRPLSLRAMPATAAVAEFAAGRIAVVLGGRFEDLPLARGVAGLSQRSLKTDPAAGLFGLAVVNPAGPLGDAEFRGALAMALDREALASALGLPAPSEPMSAVPQDDNSHARASPQPPQVSVSSAAADWLSLAPDDRRSRAAAQIGRWQTRFGPLPQLRLALPTGPGADALFAQVAADFRAVGVPVRRVGAEDPADLRLLDSTARYARSEWYLNQLSCAARKTVCSPAADALRVAARTEPDPVRRGALIARAAALVNAANVFLPLGAPVRWSLVRDGTAGFALNAAAFHPLPPLAQRGD